MLIYQVFYLLVLVNLSCSFNFLKGIERTQHHKQLTLTQNTDNKFLNHMMIQNKETVAETEDFKEDFMDIKIDHYNYDQSSSFKLRYLVKDKFFNKNITNSPILFYCGNEGGIEEFWRNSGFITETLAKEFEGLVLFGEHRFFGKSFPFGGVQDFDIKKNKFLTVEQAMGDFIELIRNFKSQNKLEHHPVIAFGGSYGGMLAAWSRMKFPHVFAGAIASSAPILLFEDINRISNSFFKIVTETYRRYDEECPNKIRKGFNSIEKIKNSTITDEILTDLNSIFKPCRNITSLEDIQALENTLEDTIVFLAQYNYPYASNFSGNIPGEPVKVACERINEYKGLLTNYIEGNKTVKFTFGDFEISLPAFMRSSVGLTLSKYNQNVPHAYRESLINLNQAASVLLNSTGEAKCIDIGNDPEKVTSSLNGWSFMACTEMIMPMQKDGITDMFNPSPWNVTQYAEECRKVWNGDVRPEWAFTFFGGRNFEKEINNYSNILFTNGKMDPWNAGCPKFSDNPTVIVMEADSAHHLDLRLPHEKDPKSVNDMRDMARKLIAKWIK